MTSIAEGMTPAQFLTAVNDNFTELCTTYGIYQNSFITLTLAMTSTEWRDALNHNLRATSVVLGQHGGSFINNLNTYFATPFPRFQDDLLENIALGAEPSAIVSEDGNTLDIWTAWKHFYTTDMINFSEPSVLNHAGIEGDHGLGRVLKEGETYYQVRSKYTAELGYYELFLMSSANKVAWTYVGDIMSTGNYGESWNVAGLANSFLFKVGSTWYLIYEAVMVGGSAYQIGLATAPAITGPYTNYEGNPILPVEGANVPFGDGRPVIATDENNNVLQVNGKYFMYYHHDLTSATMSIRRAYSTDLLNWTVEGNIVDPREVPQEAGTSNGDICVCQFKGKSYLFYSNNVNGDNDPPEHIDVLVDNRPFAEILALRP